MKRPTKRTGDLLIEDSGQLRLIDKSVEQEVIEKGKVKCLGMTFDGEEERRAEEAEGWSRQPDDAASLEKRYFPELIGEISKSGHSHDASFEAHSTDIRRSRARI
jgi:hypothetical protein